MTAHEVLTALFELKQGRVTLTAEQQAEFLDAVEGLVRALIEALRGGDRMAAAMWYAHDRTPALARFADAARPQEPLGGYRTRNHPVPRSSACFGGCRTISADAELHLAALLEALIQA